MILRRIFHRLDYLAALFRANLRAQHGDLRHTLVMSGFMFVQNLIFFSMWIVFFGSVREVKGWQLGDVGIMFGVMAMACGLVLLVADGARTLAAKVVDGSFDSLLTKPRYALPALLFSRSNAASFGDVATGPVYWFVFGGASLTQLPMLIGMTLLAACVFLSVLVVYYSLAFWLPRSGRLSDQLFETLIIFSSIPQHAQAIGTKIAMFSVIPAGFISLVPVSLLHHFDWSEFLLLLGAVLVYGGVAVAVFNAGVRRYVAARD